MKTSTFHAAASAFLLIAAPWVELSARWPVYIMGVAALALAATFYALND